MCNDFINNKVQKQASMLQWILDRFGLLRNYFKTKQAKKLIEEGLLLGEYCILLEGLRPFFKGFRF